MRLAGALRVCWSLGLVFIRPGIAGIVLVIAVQLGLITCMGVFNPAPAPPPRPHVTARAGTGPETHRTHRNSPLAIGPLGPVLIGSVYRSRPRWAARRLVRDAPRSDFWFST
jgi:hypothetical protein